MIMIIRLSTKLNFRSLSIRKYVIQEIVEPRQKARAAEKEVRSFGEMRNCTQTTHNDIWRRGPKLKI